MAHANKDEILSELLAITEKTATPSEIQKCFNNFLKNKYQDISAEIEGVLKEFRPNTNLGKLIRVKLIDRFKVSSEVIELLKVGDVVSLRHVLKCNWFFTSIQDPETFVSHLVPALSYSVRIKVLNKYSSNLKNTVVAELVYRALRNRYNVRQALPILPACGESFIRDELPNIKIKLPPAIVLAILKKYPSLVVEFLVSLSKERSVQFERKVDQYDGVLKKLSAGDLQSFINLYEKHGEHLPHVIIGRRLTKTLIKYDFHKIVEKYEEFTKLLSEKILFSYLSLDQIKTMLVNYFLPKLPDFFNPGRRSSVVNLFEKIKPSHRSEVFQYTINSTFKIDCTSHENLYKFGVAWIDFLPTESKVKWVENKLLQTEDVKERSQLISRLPVDRSIPRLKKLIESQSDAKVRLSIGKDLIKTLRFNNCPNGLKEVIAYIVKRFRNEASPFRENIVGEIADMDKLLLDVGLDDWTPFNDLMNLIKLNDELRYCSYRLETILQRQIYSAFTKSVDIEPYLKHYMEFQREFSKKDPDTNVIHLCKNTPFYRVVLEWILREFPQIQWNSVQNKNSFLVELAAKLCSYNSKNVKNQVDMPEWLLTGLEEFMLDSATQYKIHSLVDSFNICPDIAIKNRIFVSCFAANPTPLLMNEYLRTDPDLIFHNIEHVMKSLLDTQLSEALVIYKKFKLYNAYGIPKEVVKICRYSMKLVECAEYDKDEDCAFRGIKFRERALLILSLLLEPTQYLELCANYIPKDVQIDDFSEEIKEAYDIQQAICNSLIEVSPPSAVLTTLRQFAVGDFLKLVVGSLNGICVKIPENEILPVLRNWTDCPVSLRKHILRLIYTIAPTNYTIETFVDIFKKEKNISLRLVLFLKFHNTFIAEPDDDTFTTLSSIIAQLGDEDEEALKKLFEIDNIDKSYMSKHLEMLWNHVESSWGNIFPNGKAKIVKLISTHVLKLLNEDFVITVLSHILSTRHPESPLPNIVYECLLYSPSREVQVSRFNKIFSYLRPLIETQWNKCSFSNGPFFETRCLVSKMVDTLCDDSRYTKGESLDVNPSLLLSDVKEMLCSLVHPSYVLRECILLDIFTLYHKRSNLAQGVSLDRAMADLYFLYIQKYQTQLGYVIVTILSECSSPLKSVTQVAHELVTNFDNPYSLILASKLVCKAVYNEDDEQVYLTVINKLSSSEDLLVKVETSEFSRSLESIRVVKQNQGDYFD